jgi:L-2-hydroxyglutarate oxidase LhgO
MLDAVVVGGGIVGAAVAGELASRGRRVVLLEKENRLAAHQTGRNSGEIHSGIYYRPGSLKARLCVQGSALLKSFCRERGLPLVECGKTIVAVGQDELPRLEELRRRGEANGVPGVESIGPERLREIEPNAAGVGALHLPGVAITDFAAVTRALVEGIEVRVGVRVRSIGEGELDTTQGRIRARTIVACAGLFSDRLARTGVRIVPFRGEYATLGRPLVRGLVYPLPDPDLPFLGVHLTRRIDGTVEAGPNAVPAFRREGYRWRDADLRDLFLNAAFPGFWKMAAAHWRAGAREVWRSISRKRLLKDVRRLVPAAEAADLRPGRSGVRAQALDPDGRLVDYFRIVRRGGTVHVVNAPSPAATAALAIARHIAGMLE